MGLILVDTNIILYNLKGIPSIEPYLGFDFAVSDVTIIELLGVKNIKEQELAIRKKFLGNLFNYPINDEVKHNAIILKQFYTLKVPDAIIAATSISYNLPLLTADKDFKKIKELSAIIISL